VGTPDQLAALLTRTAETHHQTFIETDGVDADWPTWYARYLLDNGFRELVQAPDLTAADLAGLLIEADRQHRKEAPETPWEPYYAQLLLARTEPGTSNKVS
jgi:hypothetical protein